MADEHELEILPVESKNRTVHTNMCPHTIMYDIVPSTVGRLHTCSTTKIYSYSLRLVHDVSVEGGTILLVGTHILIERVANSHVAEYIV